MFTKGDLFDDDAGIAYRVIHEFAPGGQGFAYGVERVTDSSPFVLKHLVFGADADQIAKRTRKLVEADLVRAVSPALAAPLALVAVPAGTAYIMPFCAGRDLETLLASATLSLTERLEIAAALCAVLARLRDGGALHGDISSRNVHVSHDADGIWRVALIDLDNLVHLRLPRPPMVGTPEYLPLEALRCTVAGQTAAVTDASENFALGVLVHEIVRGAHPFVWSDGDSPAVIAERLARGHLTWRQPVGAVAACALSDRLGVLFDRSLAPEPHVRPSPGEWLRALGVALGDLYACENCGSICVNDASRVACPACARRPARRKLMSNQGFVLTLDGEATTLGARELCWPLLEPAHLRVDRVGFGLEVTDLSQSGTYLVTARGLSRLPRHEQIELRAGDRLRLGEQLELRVE